MSSNKWPGVITVVVLLGLGAGVAWWMQSNLHSDGPETPIKAQSVQLTNLVGTEIVVDSNTTIMVKPWWPASEATVYRSSQDPFKVEVLLKSATGQFLACNPDIFTISVKVNNGSPIEMHKAENEDRQAFHHEIPVPFTNCPTGVNKMTYQVGIAGKTVLVTGNFYLKD